MIWKHNQPQSENYFHFINDGMLSFLKENLLYVIERLKSHLLYVIKRLKSPFIIQLCQVIDAKCNLN